MAGNGNLAEGEVKKFSAICSLAFSNDLILDQIFSFVDFETLRNCRRVCSKWNSVITPSLQKQAKIVCHRLSVRVSAENSFSIFKSLIFPDESDFSFTSISLVERIVWKLSAVERFLFNEGRFITELEINNLALSNDGAQVGDAVDISGLVTPTLKKLVLNGSTIASAAFPPVPASLNWSSLASIDTLSVSGIRIILSDTKISPVELNLRVDNQYFRSNGIKMHFGSLFLQRFINFDRLERLIIQDTHPLWDMVGTKTLKNLKVYNLHNIINWGSSGWTVENMELQGTALTIKTRVNVNELIVRKSLVDLNAIPKTIRKLVLEDCIGEIIGSTAPVNFPDLQCLVIMTKTCLDIPSYFTHCDNITEMSICNHPVAELYTESLPKNLEKLFLNPQYSIVGTRATKLDYLVLADRHPNDMDGRELSHLPAKHLVFLNCTWGHVNFNDYCVRKLTQISQNLCETVTVGPFSWDAVNKKKFTESTFSDYILTGEGETEYFYVFKAGVGKVIGGYLVRRNIDNIAKHCKKYVVSN